MKGYLKAHGCLNSSCITTSHLTMDDYSKNASLELPSPLKNQPPRKESSLLQVYCLYKQWRARHCDSCELPKPPELRNLLWASCTLHTPICLQEAMFQFRGNSCTTSCAPLPAVLWDSCLWKKIFQWHFLLPFSNAQWAGNKNKA